MKTAIMVVPVAGLILAGLAQAGTPNGLEAMVERQVAGDGLAVFADVRGARLRCVLQRLEGEVTQEGLWLTSTVENPNQARFSVKATAVGRAGMGMIELANEGVVCVEAGVARFSRPGLVEEYRVGAAGVRQDFVVLDRPAGDGPLRVDLAVVGARAEQAADGARLTPEGSGRRLGYGRLRAVDVGDRELSVRLEVASRWRMTVVVEDAAAVYPVRIDPTFSDQDWISMGGIPGTDGNVRALALDGAGNLYAGGDFTWAGGVAANYVAQWNGSVWTNLGSGMNSTVYALALDGAGNLYAGGSFTNAGGVAANRIAQWNGSVWTNLGSGMARVEALAVDGAGNLYAGGYFPTAGGIAAICIAQWNGSVWTNLGSGMDGYVYALAVDGAGNLYAGGGFTRAGGKVSCHISYAATPHYASAITATGEVANVTWANLVSGYRYTTLLATNLVSGEWTPVGVHTAVVRWLTLEVPVTNKPVGFLNLRRE